MEITKEYIDGLIEKAGLSEIITVFNSAIEINTHLLWAERPMALAHEECGYMVLAGIIQAALDDNPEKYKSFTVGSEIPISNRLSLLVKFYDNKNELSQLSKLSGVPVGYLEDWMDRDVELPLKHKTKLYEYFGTNYTGKH